jgi:glycosyltransferase involved in cell wall biosynthesis
MYRENIVGVIILAYDVEQFIKDVIEGLPNFVDRIYVIDDRSKDHTFDVVSSLKLPKVTLIRHEINKGPGGGLKTGFQAALKDNIDIVVKIDGDGQMDSDQIENLIIPIIQKQAHFTKGNRLSKASNRQGMPTFRVVGNYILTWLTRIGSGYWNVSDTQNGFIAINNKALATIDLNFCSFYGYLNDVLARLNVFGFKVMDIPMPAKYGNEQSKIKYSRYVPKVSLILLRIWIWRLKIKYLKVRPGKKNALLKRNQSSSKYTMNQ